MAAVRLLFRPRPILCAWRHCTPRYSTASAPEFELQNLDSEAKGVTAFVMRRPAVMNAMGRNLMKQLEEAVQSTANNPHARVVILKSDVPGAFSVGADLKERVTMKEEDVGPFVSRARALLSALSTLPVPVIAALDGIAVGGGLEMALCADMRIAATNAKMGLVETRLAIIPGGGGTQRLPRLVGEAKAKELIFTARVLSGKEAAEIGLAEYVVPQNEAGDAAFQKALELAKEIAKKGPIAVRMAKKAISVGIETDLSTGLKVEESCYAQVIGTQDRVEGLQAFKEKRDPVYEGK